ncbi:MAG TPA: hypothetical protein VGO52_24460 [Hyphomonadaceae bacterium]|jgi:hypothetical protein|nr:hypothetical protein [Hyphomonadaceae bacterium]
MDAQDWSTAGVALIGVVIGGLLTFFIEMFFRHEERRETRRERLNRYHRTTHLAVNDVLSIHRQFLAELPEKPQGMIWGYLRGRGGVDPDPIRYDFNDSSVISDPKHEAAMTAFWEVVASRNVIAASLGQYNSIREQLETALAPYVEFLPDGGVKTSMRYKADASIVMLENRVETLAASLVDLLHENKKKIYDNVAAYNRMIADAQDPIQLSPLEVLAMIWGNSMRTRLMLTLPNADALRPKPQHQPSTIGA